MRFGWLFHNLGVQIRREVIMLSLSNTPNEELGKLFASLFSEEVAICQCGRFMSGSSNIWKRPETPQEWEKIRKVGKFEDCPYCLGQMINHA